jgi:excisionase family DNA binding protein
MARKRGGKPVQLVAPASETPFIRVADLAADTGLSTQSIYRAIAAKQIRGVRVGNKWIVPRSERARLLSQTVDPSE